MDLITELSSLVPGQVLTGNDAARYGRDWMGKHVCQPAAVVRPGSPADVARLLSWTYANGVPVVPVGGNTGLTGATHAPDQVMLSLERLNRIRQIRPEARVAVVEAGVVLDTLHQAADTHALVFPLFFGARGSAMLGGALSTNAGGSNVLRYGSTRALTLGLEVVLPDGRLMDLMVDLHKDNSGYDLEDLFIGAEGTLGVITAAVVKLHPKPAAYATALVAMNSLDPALRLLNRLQQVSGNAVEAFEFMPRDYMQGLATARPDLVPPLGNAHPVTILVEIGATAPDAATPGDDGTVPVVAMLAEVLAELAAEGRISDAAIAASDSQRLKMWALREAAAEVAHGVPNAVANDICLPLDRVSAFLDRADAALRRIDAGASSLVVGHLGDGNLHYTVGASTPDPDLADNITDTNGPTV